MPRKAKPTSSTKTTPTTPSAQKKATLLEELGRSPEEQPLFSLPSPLLPWGAVGLAVLLVVIAPPLIKDGPVGALIAAAITLAMIAVVMIPRKMLIGQDGILLIWLFGSQFIRFRDIDYIEMSDGFYFHHPGINIALVTGHAVDFSTSIFKERWAARDTLILLLREYCETAKRKKSPPVQQALLRSGKTHSAWARTLLAMGSGAHFDPRSPAVMPEDLLEVAENPDASTVERTAAFVALHACGDAKFDQRLRVSLDQTAAPDVRASLNASLDADNDEGRLAQILERAEKMSTHG